MLLVNRFAFLLALGRCAKLPDRPPGGRAVPRDQSLQRLVSRMLGETTMGGGGLDDRAPWELDNDDTYIELDLARSHAIAAARQHMHMLQEAQDAARLHLWQRAAPRIVMVSNRLPISVKRGPGGKLEFSVSSGGMVSALLGVGRALSARLDRVRARVAVAKPVVVIRLANVESARTSVIEEVVVLVAAFHARRGS